MSEGGDGTSKKGSEKVLRFGNMRRQIQKSRFRGRNVLRWTSDFGVRCCSPPVPRQEGEIRTKGMHCMIFLAFVLFVLIWFGFQGGTLKRP